MNRGLICKLRMAMMRKRMLINRKSILGVRRRRRRKKRRKS
jgi:hypothetical protein